MSCECIFKLPVNFGDRLFKGYLKSVRYDGEKIFISEQISYNIDGYSGLTSELYELSKINLCRVCKKCIASCEAKNVEFGDGKGNDNVYLCDSFDRIDELIKYQIKSKFDIK